MLCHWSILRDPQHRGTKSKLAASPLPSRVPKRGRKCWGFPAFSGIPNIGEQNRKWLPQPCLVTSQKEGGNAMSPLHSQGSPTPRAGSKIRNGPGHGGNKIKSGCLTRAFSGAQKRAECHGLRVFLGIPSIGEQNQKWLLHPCLLRCPKEGANAMACVYSRESPT